MQTMMIASGDFNPDSMSDRKGLVDFEFSITQTLNFIQKISIRTLVK